VRTSCRRRHEHLAKRLVGLNGSNALSVEGAPRRSAAPGSQAVGVAEYGDDSAQRLPRLRAICRCNQTPETALLSSPVRLLTESTNDSGLFARHASMA